MWQIIAVISGASVTLLMGIANVAYSMSLATGDTLGIPNAYLFAVLGISLDLLMVCTPFAYHNANPIRRILLAVTFSIASLYSVHAMHGYLKSQTASISIQQTYNRELELRLNERKPDFKAIEKLRQQAVTTASPVHGFELVLAVSLWFINSTIWYAFFGNQLTATIKQRMEELSHANGANHGKVADTQSVSRGRTTRARLI